jgi:hypothetical protein
MAKSDEIQDEIKETRDHIEATGSAMVDKLEQLEERMRKTIEGVKRNFDLHYQAERHPLALLGGSMAVGYLIGSVLLGNPDKDQSDLQAQRHNGAKDHLKDEIVTTIKGIAAGALTSTLWEMGKQALFGRGPQTEGFPRGGRRGPNKWQKRGGVK